MWVTVFSEHGYIMFYLSNYLSFCSDGGWRLFFREQGTLPRTKENTCLNVQCTSQEHENVLKRGRFSRKLIYSPWTCGVPFYKKLLNLNERTFYHKTVIKLKVDYDKLFTATLSLATPSHHSFPEIWTKKIQSLIIIPQLPLHCEIKLSLELFCLLTLYTLRVTYRFYSV